MGSFVILREDYNISVFLTDYLKGQLRDLAASTLKTVEFGLVFVFYKINTAGE